MRTADILSKAQAGTKGIEWPYLQYAVLRSDRRSAHTWLWAVRNGTVSTANQHPIRNHGCRVPLLAVLASSVFNIILDLILVGPLGVAGAAAASVLVQVLGCLFMLMYLYRTVLICSLQIHFLEKRCSWDVLRLSVPNTLQQIAPPAVVLVKQGLLGTLGVAEIGGFTCSKLYPRMIRSRLL